jgi:hypothetical protein
MARPWRSRLKSRLHRDRRTARQTAGEPKGPGSQLVTWGKATILSVDAHGFKFYTLNSAKHIPFDWEGP